MICKQRSVQSQKIALLMRWWKPWNIYKALEFVWVVKNQWFIISTCSFSSDSTRKKFTDAKEWCENGAKNGFKAGRLFEPKSQSFNDKVNAIKSKIVHKIAIESGQQKSK